MSERDTPASTRRLDALKRRTYTVALSIAGVAAMIGFALRTVAGDPGWQRFVFGPVIAALCTLLALGIHVRELPMRLVERIALALAAAFLVFREITVFFFVPEELSLADRITDFGPWMSTAFIMGFVALPTRQALPVALGIYGAVVSVGAAYVARVGAATLDPYDVNVLVQDLVVANAFTIAFLYFLSRTKEALARERTERLVMARLAHTDELTGLANRRYILQALQRAIDRASRDGTSVSVLMFDLDRFKKVNDALGHAMGDVVLRRVADMARERLRSSDEIGRYGGEEFLVVAFGAELDAATQLAERLRLGFEEHQAPDEPRFTASFGVAQHRPDEPLTALLSRVDDALYAAKARGRNRVFRDVDLGSFGAA